MKRLFLYTAMITALLFLARWLYLHQLGAVAFLSLSVFLFYKSYEEYSKDSKKNQEASKEVMPASVKKPEIIT